MRVSAATLYVGDLDPNVTEADLVDAFAGFGPTASARVCRDRASGASLRYAYLNFLAIADAERALKAMNHVTLKGKPMRVMWSNRDPSPRKSGVGNLFIKNLGASMALMELEGLFSEYGTVISCKVATDEKGRSKGFGFVQMGSEDEAHSAIQALNGSTLPGSSKKLYVSKFVKKNERLPIPQEPTQTNLYVKNLDSDISDDVLWEKFSEHGKVCSSVVMKDKDGKSRGFGFVNFDLPEHAKKALDAINGSKLGSKYVYVGYAQKKAEREKLLRLQFAERNDQQSKIQGSNVYVKNLGDSVDDKALQEYFVGCGKIIATKVIRDKNGLSRGFGFVYFSSPYEANKAVETFNGAMFHGKRLYLAIAQQKEDRHRAWQLPFARTTPVQNTVPYAFPSTYCAPHVRLPSPALPTQSMWPAYANSCSGIGALVPLPNIHNGKLDGFMHRGFMNGDCSASPRLFSSYAGSMRLSPRCQDVGTTNFLTVGSDDSWVEI